MSNNPYKFTVKGVTFDFYDLSDAIQFEQSAVEHAVKKLVALGKRSGNKSYSQDLHEAIMSLSRAQEQYNESLRRTTRTDHPFQKAHVPTDVRTIGDQKTTAAGPGPSCSTTTDPNDIEEAVRFVWALGYTDGGPP